MNNKNRSVEWLFAFAAVAIAWQLHLPQSLDWFARQVGATNGSILYSIIVDGGIPIALSIIAWLSVEFYDKIVWPLWPYSGCYRGWWIYALQASKNNQDSVEVVGFFYLDHHSNYCKIPEGYAFYVDETSLAYRGEWNANVVWINENDLRILFNMRALHSRRERSPAYYKGYIEVRQVSEKPVKGISSWSGHFQDLGDRKLISGPFYTEQLKRNVPQNGDEAKSIVLKVANELLNKAHAKTS